MFCNSSNPSAEKLVVVEGAGEGDTVVAVRPVDVVHVGADEVRLHLAEPEVVLEEAQVVLQLHVAKVMPVADPLVLGEVLLKRDHFALGGDVLVLRAGFDR